MSHWTKTKVAIKSLVALRKAAESKGLVFDQTRKTMTSSYAGKLETEAVISGKGGEAAVVREGDHYNIIIDNYSNPLAKIIGGNSEILTQAYAIEVARQEAMNMGAMILGQKVFSDGAVEIRLSVGGA